MNEERLPPVTQIGMASLALIVAGGIYLSAHLPQHVPIAPAADPARPARRCCSSATWSPSRGYANFAWPRFFAVARWSLLAYVVIAGMIEYAFLRDHVRGGPLVVLTLSLVVFAVHVPTLIGFTVARFAHRAPSRRPSARLRRARLESPPTRP